MTPENWTAVSTVVVAVFTIVLAVVGGVQAWLTRKTINLARDEFISTHRPRIVVHSVALPFDVASAQGDMKIGALISYFNKGTTAAKITEIRARIARSRLPLQTGLWVHETYPVPLEKIEGGGKGYIKLKSDYTLAPEVAVQRAADPNPGVVICMGCFIYEDDRGVRRETGFCRQLDAISERWFDPADVRTPQNSEYEYAY